MQNINLIVLSLCIYGLLAQPKCQNPTTEVTEKYETKTKNDSWRPSFNKKDCETCLNEIKQAGLESCSSYSNKHGNCACNWSTKPGNTSTDKVFEGALDKVKKECFDGNHKECVRYEGSIIIEYRMAGEGKRRVLRALRYLKALISH